MFGFVLLCGWLLTAVLIALVWSQGRNVGVGVLIGLLAGIFWPLTMWVAIGVWLRRRGRSRPAPTGRIVAGCAVASLSTFVLIGVGAPPPDPEPVAAAAQLAAVPAAAEKVLTVATVVDGDTVDLSDGQRIRVLGVDSPEQGECGYAEASEFARGRLLGKPVTVTTDPTQADTDKYGRSLRYVAQAGTDYSSAVTEAGWAAATEFASRPVQKADTLRTAQKNAQAGKRGIWGELCAPRPVQATPTPKPTPKPVATPTPQAQPKPKPAPKPQPKPEPKPKPAPKASGNCHPAYTPCVPNGPDLDCPDIGFTVHLTGSADPYRLDGSDNDGVGCE